MLRYYLAGWHIKPKGVKKPWVLLASVLPSTVLTCYRHRYNPVLGEIFRCRYDYPGTFLTLRS